VIRGISAEDRFVLGCLRGYLGDLRRVECGGLNWAEVERKIEAQRVGGAVFQGLQRVGAASSVPTALIGRLQADYYKTAGRVLEMTEEARRVLRAFQERGIEAILLKGVFLANQVYDTPGVRPMGDVDLLVRERHLPDAEAILLRLGYQQVREVMPERWEEDLHHHLAPFFNGRVGVEIHQSVAIKTHPLTAEVEGLWQRKRPVPSIAPNAFALSPEDMILHLCVHCAFRWHPAKLLNLLDVAQVLRTPSEAPQWQPVLERARRLRIERQLCFPLELAARLLGAHVPRWVRQELTDRAKPISVEMGLTQFLALSIARTEPILPLPLLVALAERACAVSSSKGRRLGLVKTLLFPPPETIARLVPGTTLTLALRLLSAAARPFRAL